MSKQNGIIVPLAWPDALVGSSYPRMDSFWKAINICKDSFYKVGHAAMLLINTENGTIEYFDFGRYIAPPGQGRIRGKNTDPELEIELKAIFKENKIENLSEILLRINNNPHTHGEGTLYAGIYPRFDFDEVLEYIHERQEQVLYEYGPFVIGGTNCSRFVAQTIGNFTKWSTRFKFLYPWYATPSPLGNIYNCPSEYMYAVNENGVEEIDINKFIKRMDILRQKIFFTKEDPPVPPREKALNGKFEAGDRPSNVSESGVWLGGLGAGAWHEVVDVQPESIRVKRVQANGFLDFDSQFYHDPLSGKFLPDQPFKVVHGTTYQGIVLQQEDRKLVFRPEEITN